jgi:hypothetical protein
VEILLMGDEKERDGRRDFIERRISTILSEEIQHD